MTMKANLKNLLLAVLVSTSGAAFTSCGQQAAVEPTKPALIQKWCEIHFLPVYPLRAK